MKPALDVEIQEQQTFSGFVVETQIPPHDEQVTCMVLMALTLGVTDYGLDRRRPYCTNIWTMSQVSGTNLTCDNSLFCSQLSRSWSTNHLTSNVSAPKLAS